MSEREVELANSIGWSVTIRGAGRWLVDKRENYYNGFLGRAFPRLMRELVSLGYSFTIDGHPEGFECFVWEAGKAGDMDKGEEAGTPEKALFLAAYRLLCGGEE
jgi:hypothetical protein